MLKNLNLMEFSRKARSVLYEKAKKTDIDAVRFALTALFSFKEQIFSTFYKNAQIFRYGSGLMLFLELICFKIPESARGTIPKRSHKKRVFLAFF
jgi:hypothetical protein